MSFDTSSDSSSGVLIVCVSHTLRMCDKHRLTSATYTTSSVSMYLP